MADIGDIIELIVDIPERNLRAGMQGAIVHLHDSDSYEIEFTDEGGETKDFLSLDLDQFIVVWRAQTHEWVSTAEKVTAIVARLPQQAAEEAFDFARFLSVRKRHRSAPESPVVDTKR